MRDLSGPDLRAYIARVFDLVVVLRRLGSGQRIAHQIAALDGLDDHGDYRLIDVFRAELDASELLRWLHNADWRPPERLRARMQLEGGRWS